MPKRYFYSLVTCFLVGFMTGQTSGVYIYGDSAAKIIFKQYFSESSGIHYQWSQDPETSYRLIYSWEESPPGEVLGQVPLYLIVNFWNPVSALSYPDIQEIFAGRIKNWSSLGGEDLPIKLLVSRGLNPYLPVTAQNVCQVVGSQSEMVKAVAIDRGGVAIIAWPLVKPQVKVVTINEINPAWVQNQAEMEEYQLRTKLVLIPPPRKWLRDWFNGNRWRDFNFRRAVRQSFSATKLFLGEPPVTVIAAGDVMLNREVAETSRSKGEEHYPFLKTAGLLTRSDLAFVNLECPVSDRGRQINMFRADPRFLESLLYAGVDLVSLANNHIMDYGTTAMVDTMKRLEEKGIWYIGAGRNIEEARKGRLITIRGVKLAFLAYTELGPGFTYTRVPQHWAATSWLPGVAAAREDYIREDVGRVRREADLVFVSMHWGKEYQHYPTKQQTILGRAALEAGADLVIGHHPHVIQGVEFGGKGIVAYSLGNFIFDQIETETKQGLILEAACDKEGIKQIHLIPIQIREEQPVVAEGKAREEMIKFLASVSDGLENEEVNR